MYSALQFTRKIYFVKAMPGWGVLLIEKVSGYIHDFIHHGRISFDSGTPVYERCLVKVIEWGVIWPLIMLAFFLAGIFLPWLILGLVFFKQLLNSEHDPDLETVHVFNLLISICALVVNFLFVWRMGPPILSLLCLSTFEPTTDELFFLARPPRATTLLLAQIYILRATIALSLLELCIAVWLWLRHTLFGLDVIPTLRQISRRKVWGRAYYTLSIALMSLWLLAVIAIGSVIDSHGLYEHLIIIGINSLVLITIVASVSLPLFLYVFRNMLLQRWFPSLLCPKCRVQIELVQMWNCPGRCRNRRAWHALAGCPQCGTKWQGVECIECKHELIVADTYNEFEVVNRGHPYVSVSNPWRTLLLLSIPPIALTAYINPFDIRPWWIMLLVASLLLLALVKPMRRITNSFYIKPKEKVANG